jgi:muramoyltetrapeptide carboxypeptidase
MPTLYWGCRGQTAAIMALSSPCEPTRLAAGLQHLQRLGQQVGAATPECYKVYLAPAQEYGTNRFLFASDTPAARAQAFVEALRDERIGAVLAARGAYGSAEMLPLVPWAECATLAPKPVIGFSDVTAVLCAAYAHGVGIPVHGPTVEASFSKADAASQQSSADLARFMFTGQFALGASAVPLQHRSGHRQTIRGKLFGGNLTVLASLAGTPWFPNLQDHLLFVEEVGERPYRVHRALLQLMQAGCLQGIRGVIAGHFSRCVHPQGLGPGVEEVLIAVAQELAVPLYVGLPAGHEPLNLVLPLGQEVRVENGTNQEASLATMRYYLAS